MKKFTFILIAVYFMSYLLLQFIGMPGYPIHMEAFLIYWNITNKFVQIFFVIPCGMHGLYRMTREYAL